MTGVEVLIGLGTNLLSACAQEIASRLYDDAANAEIEQQSVRQRAKTLETRLAECFSKAAQRFVGTSGQVDLLRTVLGDPVFVSEIASAVTSGMLTAARFEAEVIRLNPALRDDPALKALAAGVAEAFDAAIATDSELGLLVNLRRGAHLNRGIESVSTAVQHVHESVFDLSVESAHEHEETRAEVRELGRAVLRALQHQPSSVVIESADDSRLSRSLKRRFESALNELKTGSVEKAAQEFRNLIPDLTVDRPEEKTLLFRTTATLGIALYYLGETKTAEEHFDRALELNPESVRAKANKALACLSRRDYEAAQTFLEGALISAPKDLDLLKFKAQLLADQGNVQEAIEFLQQHEVEHEDYFVSLAIHYNQAAEYDKSAEAARKALQLNSNSEGGMALLADALAMPIVFRKADEKLPTFALSAAEAKALHLAVELDEKAIAILRRNGRKAALAQLLINFSAYCSAAGDFNRAASAAREASLLLPGHSAPLANLYMAQMHLDQLDEAAKTARALREIEPPEVAIMREMDALVAQEKFQAVIELYTGKISAIPALENEPHAVCLYAAALFRSLETEGAIEQLENAKRRFPNHPLVMLEEAHIREDLGELDRAAASFIAAAKSATGAYALHADQQLGLFYYRRENWEEAERHLLGGIRDPLQSPFVVRYLICLYQLERFPKCLELAEQLIKKGEFQETVWELATNCYLRFNDLRSAEPLLEELVRHSAHLRHWVKLFEVTYRLHDISRARKVLERARARHPDSFEVLAYLSGVEFTSRRCRKAFDLAARAVQIKPSDSEAHRAVVRSALFAPDPLKLSDEEKKLVQRSIAHLSGQEGSGLKSIEFSDDLSNLREILRQAGETAEKAEKLFSDKGLPMTFLSQVLGRSPLQIWAGLTSHQQRFVPMAHGSPAEQQQEAKLAREANEVVVEISALFTLKMLNILHILPQLFKKIFVPTAVFESIRTEVEETTAFKPPDSIIGLQEGEIVRADVLPESRELRKAFVRDILTFLKSDVVTLSGIQPAVWDSSALQNTIKILGEVAGHSIGIAKGRNVPLFSDDVGLRTLARNEHDVAGFCTQAVLRAAVLKGLLTSEAYDDALLDLFRHNYNFVSESADTVIRALWKDRYALTPLTTRLFSRITDPTINRDATAGILGQVLADIWLNAGGVLREQWIDLAAKNLSPSQGFLDLCGALFKGIGISLFRFPAVFFGLTQAVGRTAHFSPHQKKIWKFVQGVTARGLIKACFLVSSTEPTLKLQWEQHLRPNEILR